MDNKNESMMKNELIMFKKEDIDDIIGFKTSMTKAERFANKKQKLKILEKKENIEPEVLTKKTFVQVTKTDMNDLSSDNVVEKPCELLEKTELLTDKTELLTDKTELLTDNSELLTDMYDDNFKENTERSEIDEGWQEKRSKKKLDEKVSCPINKKLCNSVLTGEVCIQSERGKFCTFAHSIDELKPDKCNFGSDCYRVIKINDEKFITKKDIVCRLLHDNENMKSYIKRVGYEKLNEGKNLKVDKKINKLNEKKKYIEKTPVVENKKYIEKTQVVENRNYTEKLPVVENKNYINISNISKPNEKVGNVSVDCESFRITVPSNYALQALAIAIEKGKKNVVVNIV